MQEFSIADIEAFASLMYSVNADDLYLVPYSFPITFEELAAGTTQSGILTLSANADFIALGLRHFSSESLGAGQTVLTKTANYIRCLITDTSSGDQFTNGAVNLENLGANGMGECLFDFPRLLAGRGALSVQVSAPTETTTNFAFLQLELHGVLVRSWSDRPRSGQVA